MTCTLSQREIPGEEDPPKPESKVILVSLSDTWNRAQKAKEKMSRFECNDWTSAKTTLVIPCIDWEPHVTLTNIEADKAFAALLPGWPFRLQGFGESLPFKSDRTCSENRNKCHAPSSWAWFIIKHVYVKILSEMRTIRYTISIKAYGGSEQKEQVPCEDWDSVTCFSTGEFNSAIEVVLKSRFRFPSRTRAKNVRRASPSFNHRG